MLKNHLKIALRHLHRHKGYAFINIVGLAVGLAVCLVIGLFAQFKLSYDRFHPNADRVHRLYQAREDMGEIATTPPGIAQVLETTFPEVERVTVVHRRGRRLFRLDADPFFVDQVVATDEHFFEVFPYPLLRGDPATALDGPGRAVITQSLATRLFGDENPLGRTLTYENTRDYEITGVVEDPPGNVHFRFNMLLSLSETLREWRYGSSVRWNYFGGYTYVLLHEDADPAALAAKMVAYEEAADKQAYMPGASSLVLLPVTRIHLHTKLIDEIAPQSDIRYLYLFSAIALLILIIACVNYMNLATARSAGRKREVGIRKVVGARRSQLVRQFLSESIVLSLLALPLAMLLADLALPLVNRLAGVEMAFDYVQQGGMLLALVGAVLLVGLVSGSYPALFLSAFQPIAVLTGRGRIVQRGGVLLRQMLVVFQFAATIMLLIGTIVVQTQLDYVQQKRLGFDQEHLVSIRSGALSDHYEAFKQTLLESAHVKAVTSGPPLGIGWKSMSRIMKDRETEEPWRLDALGVDYDYLETLGLNLVAGRSFSPDFPGDVEEEAVILSEAAVQRFHLAGDPIGQQVDAIPHDNTIIGIVEDFHNTSLHDPLGPIAIMLQPGFNTVVLVRLTPGDVSEKIALLEQVWVRFVPDRPFEFTFLDDQIEQLYQAEQRLARVFGLFTTLAVLIACLGLFGLAAFTAEQRTKEIGIRKVLGATVAGIVVLLSKDFIRLIVVAFVAAVPLAYVVMNRWLLETFAYHISPSVGTLLLTGALVLLIALSTVSYQAIKAALADPVTALRYE